MGGVGLSLATIAGVFPGAGTVANADSIVWNNPAGGGWAIGPNWVGGSTPTSTDDAVIDNVDTLPVILGQTETVKSLVVGESGAAELHIAKDGGSPVLLMVDGAMYVGDLTGSAGVVKVIGDGVADSAVLNVASYLNVGYDGMGTIVVENGGTLRTHGSAYVASWSDVPATAISQGTVTIDGAGSSWVADDIVRIGSNGQGSLYIKNGAAFSGSALAVGSFLGGVGLVDVSGGGGVTLTSQLDVGASGAGSMSIGAGSSLSANFVTIGQSAIGTGTLSVDGGTMDAGVALKVGYYGAGILDLKGGATATADSIEIAAYAGSAGTVILDNASLSVTGASWGYLGEFGSGRLTLQNGAALTTGANTFFLGYNSGSQGVAYVLGSGSSWHQAGALTIGYDGAGALLLDDGGVVEAGSINIGVPGGTGSGAVVIGNGSHIASSGNIVVGGEGVFAVELDANGPTNGYASAGGNFSIVDGAMLGVYAADLSGFAVGQSYTIVQSGSGLIGSHFSNADSSYALSAFVDLDVLYNPNDITLEVSKVKALADVAETPNEIATAQGIESLGFGSSIHDAVFALPTADAANRAYDGLSGEIHASVKTALIEDSRYTRDAINERLRSSFATPDSGLNVWGQGYGGFARVDGDGNAAAMTRAGGGFVAGIDGEVLDHARLGIVGGYSRSGIDVSGRSSSGDLGGYHAGVYGGADFGKLGVRFGGVLGWHDIDVERNVAFANFSDRLSSSYSSRTAQAFGEVSYAAEIGDAAIEPFANLAHVNLKTDGFEEDGGDAALSGAAGTTAATFSTFGLRGSMDLAAFGQGARLSGSFGWRHAYGDIAPKETLSFAGGDVFTVMGAPIVRDALMFGAGFGKQLGESATVGVSYLGMIGAGASDHAIKADFRVKF